LILVLAPDITPSQREALDSFLAGRGATVRENRGGRGDLVVLTSNPGGVTAEEFQARSGVHKAVSAGQEFVHAAREFHPENTVIRVGGAEIGGKELLLAAGPCAVESEAQMEACARAVSAAGGRILRGGSFKPRTSPYSFQGLGAEGLRIHREVADRNGLLMMSEVLDREDLALVAGVADILQVGSRNMQNFPLLKALGRQSKPVLLKRGLASTREEFLLAAEYILSEGNGQVILCERGIRSFDPSLRNSLDLASVVLLKEMTHLPVLVDPSHATGRHRLVVPMARAAAVCGADGLLLEVHPEPAKALSDGPQAILPTDLLALSADLRVLAPVVGRTFGAPA
jgi:3-deoxy-7-phosphoheptulonate synthase